MQTQVCWDSKPWPLGRAPSAFICPSLHLPTPPTLHIHVEGELVRLGPSQAFTAPLAPTAPYLFPSLHNMVRLPSLHVLQPQGRVLRLQHSKLVGSKALLTTGKPLMILPTAKIFISLSSPNPELKQAPTILKPRKVGSNYDSLPWWAVLSAGVRA